MKLGLLVAVSVVLASPLVLGCGGRANQGSIDAVRQRAAFDLGCAEAELQVVELGRMTYGAQCADRRASYVTQCNGYGGRCQALLNGSEEPER